MSGVRVQQTPLGPTRLATSSLSDGHVEVSLAASDDRCHGQPGAVPRAAANLSGPQLLAGVCVQGSV